MMCIYIYIYIYLRVYVYIYDMCIYIEYNLAEQRYEVAPHIVYSHPGSSVLAWGYS